MTTNRRRLAWAIISVTIALTMIAIITAVFVSATKSTAVREAQVRNTKTLDNTDRTLSILLDCTTPEGECYKRGQESQKRAIDDITVIAAAAAACANQPTNTTVRAVLDCTLAELDAAADR